MSKSEPLDKKLYGRVKSEARRKFKVFPSAYASGWLTREYKRRGGRYAGRKRRSGGLSRWYREKWIDVCQLPRRVPCGRKSASRGKYPYCRPSVRVSRRTPRLVSSLRRGDIERLCRSKRRSPRRRVSMRPSRRRSPKRRSK